MIRNTAREPLLVGCIDYGGGLTLDDRRFLEGGTRDFLLWINVNRD